MPDLSAAGRRPPGVASVSGPKSLSLSLFPWYSRNSGNAHDRCRHAYFRNRPAVIERPRISQWVWRPWYAKLWWASIAAYWTVGVGALWFRPLTDFYTSSLGSFLHIAFFPLFAFLFLSIGWAKAWIDALDYAAAHPEVKSDLGWAWSAEPYDAHAEAVRSVRDSTNIYSPLSGTMFVGNSENPLRRSFYR